MAEGWQRHLHKRDANEAGLIRTLGKLGCKVYQVSPPAPFDLLVGRGDTWIPVEVKNADGRASSKGRTLTPSQVAWAGDCKRRGAPYAVIWNDAEALVLADWLKAKVRGEEWTGGSLHFERARVRRSHKKNGGLRVASPS